MIKEFTCIVCPNSCELRAEKNGSSVTVTGNRCRRGEAFAVSEMTNPVRTVTSTVATSYKNMPVLPCRSRTEIPKDRVFDVINEINKVRIDGPMKRGDVIIPDVLGLGTDIIATADLPEEIING